MIRWMRFTPDELRQALIECDGGIECWLLEQWDAEEPEFEGNYMYFAPYIFPYYSREEDAFFFHGIPEDVVEHYDEPVLFMHSEKIKAHGLARIDLYPSYETNANDVYIHFLREAMTSEPIDIDAFIKEYNDELEERIKREGGEDTVTRAEIEAFSTLDFLREFDGGADKS